LASTKDKTMKAIKEALNYIASFFKEDSCNSLARVESLILIIAGVVFAFKNPGDVAMAALLICTGVGQKVGQKIWGEK